MDGTVDVVQDIMVLQSFTILHFDLMIFVTHISLQYSTEGLNTVVFCW